MAERRMFSKPVVNSDAFLDMPASTQNLYFHLGVHGDDDGFIDSPKRVMRMLGASEDDLKLLIAKQFLIPFENGVVVVRHWKMHNYIRSDRYKPTQYQQEMALLSENNGIYELRLTDGIPNDHRQSPARLPDGGITEQRLIEGNISSSPSGEVLNVLELFAKTYEIYPRKAGKAKGLASYRAYLLKGKEVSGVRHRFNHQQLFIAVQQYADECVGKDKEYIKMFDTFMNGAVVDYVEHSKDDYAAFMAEKYGDKWEEIRFKYAN